MSKQPMQSFHLERFLKHAHMDTLQAELHKAVDYVTAQAARDEWMSPLGKTAALSKPDAVKDAMNGPHGAAAVMFGGTLGMLDLTNRVKPMGQLDVGRMRWACEVLDQEQALSKVLPQIVVRADFLPGEAFHDLQRVERDADLDVVCLSIWWHRPDDEGVQHPLNDMCRDSVFNSQRVGQGLDLEVERFKRLQDEEKMRHVMGKSAWRLALDLWGIVKLGEHNRGGLSDADLLAKILSTRRELAKD